MADPKLKIAAQRKLGQHVHKHASNFSFSDKPFPSTSSSSSFLRIHNYGLQRKEGGLATKDTTRQTV
ncbi:hypothetical protein CVT26_007459 [Gymnopilus dilepis]|uniref:Uncharacterized protein n=1 Tax=Gymnopilus dilepis TaxID=231916 RepID=A0A409WLE4_9AGAR|nr:hypothetical protein CVT26_007459 [Gymnopilus dilepis]